MSESFGTDVSRTLSALARQFQGVVWQAGKPPLDSELNLMSQIELEHLRQFVRNQVHSGFFLDPTRALDDYVADPLFSNLFWLGRQRRDAADEVEELNPLLYACVNGWIIPVTGSVTVEEGATYNVVRLNPPPESDTRIDFVFLEAWTAQVAPNPSTANKPSASKLWKYGNVEYGQANLDDDLMDPTLGFETTERVQLQYRIRVVGAGTGGGVSPALDKYTEGLNDPNITAQGTLSSPSTFAFANMRTELGDPGLWRAGDGDPENTLGTTDGFVYAVPICAIFRRNTQPFVAAALAGSPNQNGAFDRNPSAKYLPIPAEGAKVLTQMSLINDLLPEQFAVDTLLEVDGLIGSGFDDPSMDLSKVFLVVDDEVMAISAVDTISTPNTITIPAGGRARAGSDLAFHAGRIAVDQVGTGASINFYNIRPDGKFADEIHVNDIHDMRHGVCLGDWDYTRILYHNVAALMRGNLRSTWKQAGAPGGDTQGVDVVEVSYLLQDGATDVPFGTEAMDGPDGIRQVWSDAATFQGDVSLLLDPSATMNSGFIQTLDDSVEWSVGADFKPSGFLNNVNNLSPGFMNGTTIFLHIGGDDGSQGARKTFRDGGTRAVRFVSPQEFWKQTYPNESTGLQSPISLLWVNSDQANTGVVAAGAGLQSLSPAGPGETPSTHPGPMYPLQSQRFEKPFLVLGGILNRVLQVPGILGATQLIGNSLDPAIPLGEGEIMLPGFDFDALGDWYSLDAFGEFENSPADVVYPVLRGQRTLYDMLTAGGTDRTGNSSEVYLILYGDDETRENNGAFQVIGAGTVGYTTQGASNPDRLRVKFLSQSVTDFNNTTTKTVTAEVRSQITNAEDGDGAANGPASLTITLTDITALAGGASNPWNTANINPSALPGRSLIQPFNYKLYLNCSLLYHPGRGATARVGTTLDRVAIQSPVSTILRQSKAVLDPAFATATGYPNNPAEVIFDPTHVQTWNRLPSLGQWAPYAPNYGGNVVLFSEIDRENECFFDLGSKSLVFRPFQDQAMTLRGVTAANADDPANPTMVGLTSYPNPSLIPNGWDGPKDDAQIFTTGLNMVYHVAPQYMPRFGRYDIPYYQDQGPAYGAGVFLEGINHLFKDGTDLTDPVFAIIGGDDNQSGGTQVTRMLLQTGTSSGLKYGQYATITGTLSQAYQGRLTSEIGTTNPNAAVITAKLRNIASSDFGTGLAGIQLPPYLGIARLYGVYDRRDFVAKGAVTYQDDRVTPEANRATNLLRRDSTKQTLFLLQDGAKDLTGVSDDHTYIIPSNVIDITKSPNYVDGETFDDLEYVVEFTCFGFPRGFINKNSFVLARRHTGQGALITDGSNPEWAGVSMVIPSACADSSRVYTETTRTVYQGDPYMTRNGSTRVTSDYEERYGQISQSDAIGLATSIQQFGPDGTNIPSRTNVRSLQVLASLDFYTTMGTGNMGGKLFAGTPTDVGFTENSVAASTRIPESASEPAWRILTRAFTEGQRNNVSRARAALEVTGNNATFVFGTSKVTVRKPTGEVIFFVAFNGPTVDPAQFDASSPDPAVIAREIFDKVNARTELQNVVVAFNDMDTPLIEFVAWDVGAAGNAIQIEINDTTNFLLRVPLSGTQGLSAKLTTTYLVGGEDLVVNAGDGTTQLELTGMTERLPLGILLNDCDFLGENPLGDHASAVHTSAGGIRPVQTLLPLTKSGGQEYTRATHAPGEMLAQADGGILQYTAYSDTNPGGSKAYRLYRGGGSVFVLNGPNPGGPADWVSDSLPPSLRPVLKGGLLACKVLLVRNFPEQAFATEDVTTEGDEMYLVVISNGILGNTETQRLGVTSEGIISPTGYGEGTAASDRYRLHGKPLYMGRLRQPKYDASKILLAFYPGRTL